MKASEPLINYPPGRKSAPSPNFALEDGDGAVSLRAFEGGAGNGVNVPQLKLLGGAKVGGVLGELPGTGKATADCLPDELCVRL